MLVSLFGPRFVSILSDVMFCGMLLVTFVGLVRISYVKVYGKWPNNRGTRGLAFVMELFSNVLGSINKGLVATGKPPLFTTPEVDERDSVITDLRARLAALEPAPAPRRAAVLRATTLPQGVPSIPADLPAMPDEEREETRYQAARVFVAEELGARAMVVPDEIPPVVADSPKIR